MSKQNNPKKRTLVPLELEVNGKKLVQTKISTFQSDEIRISPRFSQTPPDSDFEASDSDQPPKKKKQSNEKKEKKEKKMSNGYDKPSLMERMNTLSQEERHQQMGEETDEEVAQHSCEESSGEEQNDSDEEDYEVERIVDSKMDQKGQLEYLVHWKGWSHDYDSWLDYEKLNCPELIDRFHRRYPGKPSLSGPPSLISPSLNYLKSKPTIRSVKQKKSDDRRERNYRMEKRNEEIRAKEPKKEKRKKEIRPNESDLEEDSISESDEEDKRTYQKKQLVFKDRHEEKRKVVGKKETFEKMKKHSFSGEFDQKDIPSVRSTPSPSHRDFQKKRRESGSEQDEPVLPSCSDSDDEIMGSYPRSSKKQNEKEEESSGSDTEEDEDYRLFGNSSLNDNEDFSFEDGVKGSNHVLLRRLTVTLDEDQKITKTLKADRQMSCRAFRLVDNDMERFLAVLFPIQSNRKNRINLIRGCMINGIELEGKLYRFLGFSDNDLKEQRQIYFLEGSDYTAQSLLEAFGDLKSVWRKEGAKYFARFGMCFSSSIAAMKIPKSKVQDIPDITKRKGIGMTGEWNFSDGCGLMSYKAAEELAKSLKLSKPPSVVQFRWGGAKGVVLVHPPHVIEKIVRSYGMVFDPEIMMYLRKSNRKFNSGIEDFEVLKYGKRGSRNASLNSMAVLLLNDIGIPFENIVELLDKQLETVKSIPSDYNAMMKFIPKHLTQQDGSLYNKVYEMRLAEIPMDEPHLAHLLRTFQRTELTTLKNKLRVDIPDSRYLFGVIDDLGVLKPNEVYATFGGSALQGDIIVFRHPCFHVGDIQRLRAVNHPALSHITEPCIIFPSTGTRPIPDTMGGGDLDGDTFFVSACPLIIPPVNKPPAHYDGPKKPSPYTDRDLEEASLDFFVDFGEKDVTGLVANTWLSVAQMFGSESRDAVELAILFGRAIDATKTGVMEVVDKKFDKFKHITAIVPPSKAKELKATRKFNPLLGIIKKIESICPEEETKEKNDLIPLECFAYQAGSARWDYHYRQAAQFVSDFNRGLHKKIEEDQKLREEKISKRKKKVIAPLLKPSEEYTREFRNKHFSNLPLEEAKIKASAWYFYSYEIKKKPSFGWIAYPYLNNIVAEQSWKSDCRPAPQVAKRPKVEKLI
eukprot:TRINITY_DN3802_c0_g1_i1.p1 TRINITY_DN3802_c0_g1~~TRINITY_DN3802_c0_g1_i1.p1  ORF type:complete len:1137 (-),score=391.48 TRINITY_DN3802_c0_g1_i1:32-3442(-)